MANTYYVSGTDEGGYDQFLRINGSLVTNNDKVIVVFYSNQPDDNIGTCDFYQNDLGLLETSGTVSNEIYVFIKSTDELTVDVDAFDNWCNNLHSDFIKSNDIEESEITDTIKSTYANGIHHENQLESLDDYPHFVAGAKLFPMDSSAGYIYPHSLDLTGGSGSVIVSYESSDDYNVSPTSPITVGSENVELKVTLIDGYNWDSVDQQLTIDGNTITGVVLESVCVFTFNVNDIGSGGNITWGLHYTAVTPPSEDRVDFFTIYAPTNKNMNTINNSIFISSSGTSDIMKYFSSYKKFFVNIPIDGYKELKASQYDFGETAPYIKKHTIDVDCGSVNVKERFQSLLDYSPFSRLTIYLPFIGFESVDLAMVMCHNLKVQYKVDILSGRCLAKLYTDSVTPESCIAEYGGTIAADEIFGLNSGVQYYGSYELMTTLQLGELQPYLILSSKIPLEDSIADYEGLPTNEIVKVGDAVGFIKYSSIYVEGITATDIEKSEIENLLKIGIVV